MANYPFLVGCFLSRDLDLVEQVGSSPASFASQVSRVLPLVVLEGEHDGFASHLGRDARDGFGLLRRSGTRGAVAAIGVRGPSGLQVDGVLAGAELVSDFKLALDEDTSILGAGFWVEEGVDVAADYVDNVAPETGVFLPDVERLGGGARSLVSSGLEGGFARGDETSESRRRAGLAHHSFVSDNDQLYKAPLAPSDDFCNLFLGAGNPSLSLVDEDSNDHLQIDSWGRASGSNVRKSAAVSAVDTNNRESFRFDQGDVFYNLLGSLACSRFGVWSVGDTPLVS